MYGMPQDLRFYSFPPHPVNAGENPLSYYHSPPSEGSDAGSPSGGGGGSGSGGSYNSSSTSQQTQIYSYPQVKTEDTPFGPGHLRARQTPPSASSSRGFAVPSDQPTDLEHVNAPFGNESQYNISAGQYGLHSFSQRHGQVQSSVPTEHSHPRQHGVHLQQSFGQFGPPPQGAGTLHVESTPSPSSQSSTGSAQHYGSATVAPSALQSRRSETSQIVDAGNYLRHQLGLPPHVPVNLDCLPDPPPGRKPAQPYPILIKLAIYGSPQKKLTLKGVYSAIENRFEWFRNQPNGAWKRSIRHNLSLNQVFRRTPRPITEPGKGNYWELDVSRGEGYKRERKRRNKRQFQYATQENDSDSDSVSVDDEDYSDISSRHSEPSSNVAGATTLVPQEIGTIGPFRTVPIMRRSSPYPRETGSSRVPTPMRTYTSDYAHSTSLRQWAGDVGPTGSIGQTPQGQMGHHAPQPTVHSPFPQTAAGYESPQPVFSSRPFAATMAWHVQQHQTRQDMRPVSGVSQDSYALPASAMPSTSSSHGHGNTQYGSPSSPYVFGADRGGIQLPYETEQIRYQRLGQSGDAPVYQEPAEYDDDGGLYESHDDEHEFRD
ncbi:hypothetical protein AX17_005523 [Amanita inopinata Kibby_2008]|nr:hypothetical protein AX17_005523 [Amanita inopinata Kibby_2008]